MPTTYDHLLTERQRDGYIGEHPGDFLADCDAVMHDCTRHLKPTGRTTFKPGDLGVGGFDAAQMECTVCGGVKC